MKKLFLTIFNILLVGGIFGQVYNPLIRANTFWDVQHGDGSKICHLSGGHRYFFQGDTIIIGNQYKIIQSYPIISLLNPGPYCPPFAVNDSISNIAAFMREDTLAKKVYVFYSASNTDELLYDFTLAAGDTLNSLYAGQGLTLVIDSINTTTLLNGATRKIWYLNNNEFYIESIGGSQGLWFPIVQGIGFWQVPTCVNENNVKLWGNECFRTVDINETEYNKTITIYPNPSNNFLWIERINQSIEILKIFDLLGNVVLEQNLIYKMEKIDISKLINGTYLYNIDNKQKGKIIVLNKNDG